MFYSPSCLYFPQVSPPPFAHFLAITCTDGKFPALVVKHFTSYPTEETFNLFLGAEMTGTPLLTYKGLSTNGNTEKTWDVCLSPGEYTLQYVDTFGDGWGSSTNPAYVYIQAGGITLFRGGLPYQSGTTLKNGSDTFNLNPTLSFSATWKYTDTAPASNWNTPSFSDLSWSTANSQAMPAFSAVTRYYRVTTTVPALDSFSSYVLSLLTSHGAVIYVQGTEVYRNRVPADATSTTSATGTPQAAPRALPSPSTSSFFPPPDPSPSPLRSTTPPAASALTTLSLALKLSEHPRSAAAPTTSSVAAQASPPQPVPLPTTT